MLKDNYDQDFVYGFGVIVIFPRPIMNKSLKGRSILEVTCGIMKKANGNKTALDNGNLRKRRACNFRFMA